MLCVRVLSYLYVRVCVRVCLWVVLDDLFQIHFHELHHNVNVGIVVENIHHLMMVCGCVLGESIAVLPRGQVPSSHSGVAAPVTT